MEMQLRINEYWSKRSDEFADARYQDLHSQKKEEWLSVIRSWFWIKRKSVRWILEPEQVFLHF